MIIRRKQDKTKMIASLKGILDAERYVDTLRRMHDLDMNFCLDHNYIARNPERMQHALDRIDHADYRYCCAMLTLLTQQSNFGWYYMEGYVLKILNRMIDLLEMKRAIA